MDCSSETCLRASEFTLQYLSREQGGRSGERCPSRSDTRFSQWLPGNNVWGKNVGAGSSCSVNRRALSARNEGWTDAANFSPIASVPDQQTFVPSYIDGGAVRRMSVNPELP